MNADGSGQKTISGLDDFEIFNIALLAIRSISYKKSQTDQTANEKHSPENERELHDPVPPLEQLSDYSQSYLRCSF
ncbi:MAG: hypothetical protein IPJ37_15800 [Bacteroidales bacterium]|nr:hypothetical protein [Bacteroidales bacterium]